MMDASGCTEIARGVMARVLGAAAMTLVLAACAGPDVPREAARAPLATPNVHWPSPVERFVVADQPGDAPTELWGEVLPVNGVAVTAPNAGVMLRLLVPAGTEAAAGEPLVELARRPSDEERLELEILALELELAVLRGDVTETAAADERAAATAALVAESIVVDAPVTGVVSRPAVSLGRRASEGEPIVYLGVDEAVVVQVEVPAGSDADAEVGSPVVLESERDGRAVIATGRVVGVESNGDGEGTLVRITPDSTPDIAGPADDARLTVGSVVRVGFGTTVGGRAWVPEEAVRRDGRHAWLRVVDSSGEVRPVTVTVVGRAGVWLAVDGVALGAEVLGS